MMVNSLDLSDFAQCEICGAENWSLTYAGPVRDGVFGRQTEPTVVGRCGGCGVDRLAEATCAAVATYEGEAYRRHLNQGSGVESYFREHDSLQRFTLEYLWPQSLRGKVVADVGCAGGSLLDHVAGLASTVLAIDPAAQYHQALSDRGYQVYADAAQAAAGPFAGGVDVAFAIQVIEHVANPRNFLAGIRELLTSDGILVLSTPNRNDILMHLLADDFPAFFYRAVHRWYFDADSLAACVEGAGFEVLDQSVVHRFGMSNALAWLRDRRPTGRNRMPGIDETADRLWSAYLKDKGVGDTLYVTFGKHQ